MSERQTPAKSFRIPILQALVDAGGSASRKDLTLLVGAKMTFVAADLVLRPDGAPKWMRRVGYVVGGLRQDGLIEPANRNGNHITEKGREYVSRSW